MGFLKIYGRPLQFEESKQYFEFIKEAAVETVIDWINSTKELHKITKYDEEKKVLLDLTAENDIKQFAEKEEEDTKKEDKSEFTMHFEYGRWMIEVVPRLPLTFCKVYNFEESMENMYNYIGDKVGFDKTLSISSFPKLGDNTQGVFYSNDIKTEGSINNKSDNSLPNNEEFKDELTWTKNPYSDSEYIDDVIINTHPRFGTLTRNIRTRRGSKVDIKIPIYIDTNTDLNSEPYPGFIHMDAMAFGMGSCCLQATIGSCSLNSTCLVYDQFIPLSPILLALSSSGPIYKGKLSNYDNRFDIISQSVDDRNESERDVNSPNYIPKSRYSPAYSYISENAYVQDFHNDGREFPINKKYYEKMVESGLPKRLAKHFSNLLVRDPLVIFENNINLIDKNDRSHFENFNSTNWNSVRFKLPRAEDNDECFKVEVRSCDLQLTPFENSSMLGLILSFYLSVLNFDVNFIIPISKVDENFRRAYQMDAINTQKFFWRVNGIDKEFKNVGEYLKKNCHLAPHENIPSSVYNQEEDNQNIKELTIKEIMLGSQEYNYPGVITLCREAIKLHYPCNQTREFFKRFLDFQERRATGELWTDAKYIRNFVMEHPKYMKDSLVTDEIQYDLINHLLDIQNRKNFPEQIFGKK